MIIAVTVMDVMKMPIDEVIRVIAMRNRVVPAVRAMNVARRMPLAAVARSAAVGICSVYFDGALIDVIAMRHVQMTVVKIVDVPVVLYGAVSAVRSMNVLMTRVYLVVVHRERPPVLFMQR